MNTRIENLGWVLIGLGGGLLLSLSSAAPSAAASQAIGFGWGLAGLSVGVLLVLVSWLYQPLKNIFAASVDDWEYEYSRTSDTVFSVVPEKLFECGKHEAFWEGQPQNIGDSYRLDMRKGRVISGVNFDEGGTGKIPAKWQMFLYDSFNNLVSPHKDRQLPPHIDGEGPVVAGFSRAVKARYIQVRITAALSDRTWEIRRIRVKERRLPGGLWNVAIGER